MTAAEAPYLIIEPGSGWRGFGLKELWPHRELLYFLCWRDVKVRYKQTVLGVAWAILQPLFTMILFTFVFGRLGGLEGRMRAPYPVFAYSGILLWTFFATAVTQSALSLIGSSQLISKVYFPRLIIPVAAVGGGIPDLAISCVMLLLLVVGHGLSLGAGVLLLPLFLASTLVAAIGAGTFLSALSVAYRDFRHLTGFLVQSWLFLSPVAYPLELVPERWRALYALNPMVGPIVGCRSAVLGEPFPWESIAISGLSALALLVVSTAYFRRVERTFADLV